MEYPNYWDIMDLYVLDDMLERVDIVDDYISFIWTERWAEFGDFELEVITTPAYQQLLVRDTFLTINQSEILMVIEEVLETVTEDGRKSLKITGRSLEYILEERIVKLYMNGLEANSVWPLSGKPGDIVRAIVRRICQEGLLSTADIIPFLVTLPFDAPSGSLPEPADSIKMDQEVDNVYNVVKAICDAYQLGFRLRFLKEASVDNPLPKSIAFEVTTGRDMTSSSGNFNSVIFDTKLDNFSDTTKLTSIKEHKTVAYVFAKNGARMVYASGYSANTPGFKRRVLLVKPDTDLPAGAELQTLLQRIGIEELSKSTGYVMMDGEISRHSYQYGIHYFLGDLVEVRDADGLSSQMRVTEQIFSSSAAGVKKYPTLTHKLTVEPGTWASWDGQPEWANVAGVWKDF